MAPHDGPDWLFRRCRAYATKCTLHDGPPGEGPFTIEQIRAQRWEVVIEFTDPVTARDWTAHMVFKVIDGRVIATEVHLTARDDKAITAEAMREVPWGSLISDVRADLADYVRAQAALAGPGDDVLAPLAARIRDGSRRVTRDKLEEVAAIYRRAALDGQPTEAVARELNLNRSTAGKWVMRARKAGLLGPAKPGKAGEEVAL